MCERTRIHRVAGWHTEANAPGEVFGERSTDQELSARQDAAFAQWLARARGARRYCARRAARHRR